ncbi:hypothetical protein BC332_14466 [Capsicum chinense]|nr:hypothetical protein BC332_14466 [Capsicum chinense]
MVIFPTIWSLAKLRHVDICDCDVFDLDIEKPTELENLTTLEHLNLSCSFDFHFPSSLKEVKFHGINLKSDALLGIGRSLPNLEKLQLIRASIEGGKEWNMEQVTFPNLKSLKLYTKSFFEWQVIADESFPVIEKLKIYNCTVIIEIPESFRDIASLMSISLWLSPQLKESALKIKEYVEEMTGEDKIEVKYT